MPQTHDLSAGTRSKCRSFIWPQQPQRQMNQTEEGKKCSRTAGVSISGATPSTTLNGNFHVSQTDKPPDDRSKVSRASGGQTRLNLQIVTHYFLRPIRLGGKRWQKHCTSGSNQMCLDARRPVATRLQTLRLDFPLVIYCRPSARSDE